jgi:pimeloyl-ACP methyl ester carboxylesterase
MDTGTENEEVTDMSRTDDLRAARESRAGAAQRTAWPGMGDAVTRMVNAAVYRATHRPGGSARTATTTSEPATHAAPEPLGPGFASAMRTARARVTALRQSGLHTPDGAVRYVDRGTGPPVLLVHGIFGGADAALRQLGSFVPDGFRVIAPSRFGYLGSAIPADPSPARQADAFAALLDDLHIAKTAVVAVSAGGTCALQFAIRYPERVSALVLVSSNGPGCQHDRRPLPRAVAAALWGSDRLMWLARRRFTTRLLGMMGIPASPRLGPFDRARVSNELDGVFPVTQRVQGALFDAFVSNPDINHGYDFRRITAPTLIVHARDDALAPCWGAAALRQSIPGARLLVVENGGGHLMLGDHPEVAVEIQTLLRSTSDPTRR